MKSTSLHADQLTSRRLAGLPLCLLLLRCALPVQAGEERVIEEHWLLVSLNGQPAGLASTRVTEEATAEGLIIRTVQEANIRVSVGILNIRVSERFETSETLAGRPLGFSACQDDGQTKVVTDGVFEADKLRLHVRSPGGQHQRELPVPPGLLVGYAEERMVRAKGFTPGLAYSYPSYMPDVGVVTLTRRVLEPAEIMLPVTGRKVKAHRLEVTGALPGITMTEYRDHEGMVVFSSTPMFGMTMTMEAMPEGLARRHAAGTAAIDLAGLRWLPVEFAHPRPRDVASATFVLSSTDGRPFEKLELEGPGVRADALPDGSLRVAIEYPHKYLDASGEYASGDGQLKPEWLAPGPYVNSDDPGIARLAASVAAGATNRLEIARRLEAWVRANMSFTPLGQNFQTGRDAFRERRGDCTEAAVLLASLLRAASVPCRLAAGVAMLDGKMGFHMWVEVYAGRKGDGETWAPFDSAIYSPGRVDATHVRFAAIADDAQVLAHMGALAQLIGRLRMRALRYVAGGMVAEPGRPWCELEERPAARFVHRGLLVSFPLPVPAGWRIGALDARGGAKLERADGSAISIDCREVAPEEGIGDAVAGVSGAGFRLVGKPEYGVSRGRRWVLLTAESGELKRCGLYMRDGNYMLKFTAAPEAADVFRRLAADITFHSTTIPAALHVREPAGAGAQ